MCTVVMRRAPGERWPLIVAANRDEIRDRPWRSPDRHWPEQPDVVGGLDVRAGGTWLALSDAGVMAAVLNRYGFLGTLHDKRSRGLLPLDALAYPDARTAADALAGLDVTQYQPFNLVVADADSAFWLKHAGPDAPETERNRIRVEALPEGVSMLTAGNVNDATDPRIRRFLPRFTAAAAPDPDAGDWGAWTELLATRAPADATDPREGMTFTARGGFATLCSTRLALPDAGGSAAGPVMHFAPGPPDRFAFAPVAVAADTPAPLHA